MFSAITNIHNKKTKGPTLMKLLTATGKLKRIFIRQMLYHLDAVWFKTPNAYTQHSTLLFSTSIAP